MALKRTLWGSVSGASRTRLGRRPGPLPAVVLTTPRERRRRTIVPMSARSTAVNSLFATSSAWPSAHFLCEFSHHWWTGAEPPEPEARVPRLPAGMQPEARGLLLSDLNCTRAFLPGGLFRTTPVAFLCDSWRFFCYKRRPSTVLTHRARVPGPGQPQEQDGGATPTAPQGRIPARDTWLTNQKATGHRTGTAGIQRQS